MLIRTSAMDVFLSVPMRSQHKLEGSGPCSIRSAKSDRFGIDGSFTMGSMAGSEVFG
uniref:Uncharacterized protein n=1 Tax=Arundo donax TaxID=35708 RepID=A0A0A8YX35_ARUDO